MPDYPAQFLFLCTRLTEISSATFISSSLANFIFQKTEEQNSFMFSVTRKTRRILSPPASNSMFLISISDLTRAIFMSIFLSGIFASNVGFLYQAPQNSFSLYYCISKLLPHLQVFVTIPPYFLTPKSVNSVQSELNSVQSQFNHLVMSNSL